MREFSRWLCLALVFASMSAAHAQSSEAPPREPPYVDDNEFDPVQNEDPSASADPVPNAPVEDPIPAPSQQSETPVVEQAPRPSNRASRPAYSSGDVNRDYKSGTPEKVKK